MRLNGAMVDAKKLCTRFGVALAGGKCDACGKQTTGALFRDAAGGYCGGCAAKKIEETK